jgi:peptide/nickel transport system substrate-binding protein
MPRLRLLRALVFVALLAVVLAACGGGAPAAPEPTAAPVAQPATSQPAQPTAAPAEQPTATAEPQPTAAPAEQPTAAAAPSATGGTLRIGRTAGPDSLNPGAAYLVEAGEVEDLVYDSLIAPDLRGQPIPQLAKEWSASADGKTWTFKLHEGATWHDGKPVTSEDVAFTYNMIKNFDEFGLIKPYTSLLTKIETPDPTTVVMTFEGPIANSVERFSAVYILPKHIWEKFKDSKSALEYENTDMIGSGPFKLAEYKQGEFTRLTAVKDHYLSPPKIDEVIFRVYGNADAEIQALKTGEVDFITGFPATAVRSLQSEANVKVEIGKQRSLTDIIFNVIDPKNCPKEKGKCTGHPALRDVKVRQALAYATDKQALIDTVLLGLGTPGLTMVTPGQGEGYNSTLQDYPFDVEKAKQILEEAGYKDSDGDGIREMPGDPKKPLSFRYSFPSDQDPDGPRLFELLSEMWKQAGVEIRLQGMEADALTAICCPAFDFDVINWGWTAGVDPSSLLNVPTTEEIPTGTSESGYSNPEYDKLYKDQEVTADKAKRKELLDKLQEILVRDVPYIIPYYSQKVEAYRTDRFQGWMIDPEGVLSLVNRLSVTAITPVQQ